MSPALIAVLIAGAVLAVVVTVSNARRSASAPGLVWSAEHGHYHDASGSEVPR